MLGDRNVPSSNLVFSTTTYDTSQKKSYRFIEEEHMEMLQAEGKWPNSRLVSSPSNSPPKKKDRECTYHMYDSNITASVVTIVRLAYIIINSTP